MNAKFFVLTALYWIVVLIVLIVLFYAQPSVAQSRWVVGGLVVISLIAVVAIRKLSAPKS